AATPAVPMATRTHAKVGGVAATSGASFAWSASSRSGAGSSSLALSTMARSSGGSEVEGSFQGRSSFMAAPLREDAIHRRSHLRARGIQTGVGGLERTALERGDLRHRQLLQVEGDEDRALVVVERVEGAIE